MSENQQVGLEVAIQRVYLKDLSFESPGSPKIFEKAFKPKIELDLRIENKSLGNDSYEVVLITNVSAKEGEEVAFIIEVEQGAVFTLKGNQESIHRALGTLCPEIIFPYVRETIDQMANRGTFPPLHLAPINFNALYQNQMNKQNQQ